MKRTRPPEVLVQAAQRLRLQLTARLHRHRCGNAFHISRSSKWNQSLITYTPGSRYAELLRKIGLPVVSSAEQRALPPPNKFQGLQNPNVKQCLTSFASA